MLKPTGLQRTTVRAAFNDRLGPDGHSDFLLREVERRMLERLDLIKLNPVDRVLDVGCGLGQSLSKLAVRYPRARMIGIDLADRALARAAGKPGSRASMAAGARHLLSRLGLAGSRPPPATMPLWLAGDAHALPFAANSIDMVWSNLSAHWFDDPLAAVAEWHRVIRPEGLLMFSAFGVDTLKEVKPAGREVKPAGGEVRPAGGAGWPSFQDMHDWGDALTSAGFADPVMDAERLTLTYEDPDKCLREAESLVLQPAVRSQPAPQPLALSIELIYGHAWCPSVKRRTDGLATVQFRPIGSKL